MRDLMRTVRFSPYRKGMGPTFTLKLYDIGGRAISERERIGYELSQRSGGKVTVVFAGEDFGPSPMHGWDSDDSVKALMSFLTLRKGDTDAEYFKDYSPTQFEFSEQYAEALSLEVYSRFGE